MTMATSAQKRLTHLFQGLADIPAVLDCWVADIEQDSRKITQGALFIAAEGIRANGAEFIQDAIQRGAVAVLKPGVNNQVYEQDNVVFIELETVKHLVGEIAHRFFGQVTRGMQVIGVTGTNGKTSVSHYIAQLACRMGVKAAVIGTLGYGEPGRLKATTHTTPDAVAVHRHLFDLYAKGFKLVAMEVSSHALDQFRVSGVQFQAGLFTNLSRDHLDYHGDMQSYALAKKKLFEKSGIKSVFNLDDEQGQAWATEWSMQNRLTFSAGGKEAATLWAENVSLGASGMQFRLCSDALGVDAAARLIGRFNLENLLASVAGLLALGFDLAEIAKGICTLRPVEGRMEPVEGDAKAPTVIVDYAHTPDALAAVLQELRKLCTGRLWCLFGCGGDRDSGKRPLMGEVAETWADRIVLTDDNPRSESPERILQDILQGIKDQDGVQMVQPRDKAITQTIEQAECGDIVLIAGKGHEDYQEINGIRHAFSDVEVANAKLKLRAIGSDAGFPGTEGRL